MVDTSKMSVEELADYVLKRKQLDRMLCEESYYHFFKQAWKVLEPETKLNDAWYIKYLCDLLQMEVERIIAGKPKNKDYIINIAPRSGKSYIATVMLAPWIWTRYPSVKIINSSFSMELSTKLCLDSRRLILSSWYQFYWSDKFKLTSDMNTKSWYENDKRGMRKSTSTGAQITGTGADIIINDDPQNPEEAESDTERETVKRHYGKTLYSRLNNQRVGLRINIQQRLHEEDLTGHLLANDPQLYTHICIPTEESEDVKPIKLKKNYIDGLFDQVRFPWSVLENAKLPTNLGAYGYSGQMLQRPSPPEGGTFKRYWWCFWKPKDVDVSPIMLKQANGELKAAKIYDRPDTFEQVIDSWDLALEGEIESDDVCGSKWGKVAANKYLLARIKGKLNYPDSKKAVVDLYKSHIATSAVIIEKAANGPAVKADLENVIPGIITKATGRLSKEDRVKMSDTVPYQAQVAAGNIILPHPEICPWVWDWIEEHATFPKGAQDGQVDSGGQAVNHLTTAKYIFNTFRVESVIPFNIKWKATEGRGSLHYGSMVQLNDLSVYFLESLWDDVDGQLFIYGCWMMKELIPATVVPMIRERMRMREFQHHKIMGNDVLFAKQPHLMTPGQAIRQEFKRIRLPVRFSPPVRYDQMGAITSGVQMFGMKKIYVDVSCTDAARQFAGWIIENGKPTDAESGYCIALCQILSELRRKKIIVTVPPVPDYTFDKRYNPKK